MTVSNGPTYFKYSVLLICVIAAIYFARTCGGSGGSKTKTDTISVTIEKRVEIVRDSIVYVPKPYKVTEEKIEYTHQPMGRTPIDTNFILRDYYATRFYSDTQRVKGGTVIIDDTVSQNMITGRSLKTNIEKQTIIKTVTLAREVRSVGYFGIGAFGNQNSVIYGTEATLSLKNKSDRIYQVGAVMLKGGEVYYKAAILIPIRIGKK